MIQCQSLTIGNHATKLLSICIMLQNENQETKIVIKSIETETK